LTDIHLYWVAISMVKGIGAVRFRALIDFFGDAEMAWNAPAHALREAGLSEKIVTNLLQLRGSISLEKVWERMETQDIKILIWDDPEYPRRLREIDQPPPVLYYRGSLTPEDEWAVAIVGTRRNTPYGRQVAEDIASTLARSGITVVSGLARGIDAFAHHAAVDAGGRSLAVLGCGVDHIYPPENRRLAEQVITQGALVSDYPPGTAPEAVNFPARNRIISGLSLAVVIVEAGVSSGAIITAAFAADQGREVFAIPGNINAPQSQGANRLIRDGARPLLNPQEILEVLDLQMVPEHREARIMLPTDAIEATLYRTLSQEPTHIDEIRARADLPIDQVTASLAMMELKGLVRQVGGMHYIALREVQEGYLPSE
jgi:DNA processing protein